MIKDTEIIIDDQGKNVVLIHNIEFEGRQHINWNQVEHHLKQYIGTAYRILETSDLISIGNDFPDEFSSSKYTAKLKGTLAKAKANASLGLPEMIKIASDKYYTANKAVKHQYHARNGWYHYTTRFALPVFDNHGKLIRYNTFRAELLVRHSADNKLYLYDMLNIKKETALPASHNLQ